MTKQIESECALSYEQACKEVWECLSQVDVNEHTSDKNGLTYLSWAWAVDTMMRKFPTFNYEMLPVTFFANGTAEVSCTVSVIHGGRRMQKFMWLPVMEQQRGKQITATVNPDSLAINKTKMRCLTKGISMLGLGAYIFAGEDLPSEPEAPVAAAHQAVSAPAPQPALSTNANPVAQAVNVADTPQPQTGTSIADEAGAEEMTAAMINIAKNMHSGSMADLIEFWQINKQTIDALDNGFPNQYAKLKAAFTEIKQALSQPQEAAS